ncbi:hypothetical protein CANTEDRAFT_115089, partial [Yamadazyma tenuis ATCC 10573]
MSDIENQIPVKEQIALNNDSSFVPASVTKIKTEGDYIQFGHEKYLKSELVDAFGGDFNPGLSPPPKHDLANPSPLGLSAFALTTFVLSLINLEARGVTIPNVVVGLAFFYGGATQLVAGMFEIAVGNTFGGVGLSSYGGFWCAWAAFYVESFGISAAYTDEREFHFAVAIFLLGWFIFTFFLMLLTLKSTVAFFSIFFFLSITFLLLAIADFQNSVPVKKAGGVFGLLTAFAAWYNAYAGLANKQNSYVTVKAIPLPDLEGKKY